MARTKKAAPAKPAAKKATAKPPAAKHEAKDDVDIVEGPPGVTPPEPEDPRTATVDEAKPGSVLVVTTAFYTEHDGAELYFRAGDMLRASSSIAKKHPEFLSTPGVVRDGDPIVEID